MLRRRKFQRDLILRKEKLLKIKLREFYYTTNFSEDGLSLTAQVQGKKIELDKEALGIILDVAIMGMRTVGKQQPSTEFMVEASKVGGTSIAGVKKELSHKRVPVSV